ncbi:hypothetical protein [Streptomyces sp. bgisy027]|uniref:hypothetical protein n=1 Tax=Streptomyces sp. bgisy027 TaxID=3413770 RepID=UPI003D71A600
MAGSASRESRPSPEVRLPGPGGYAEVGPVSNAREYQARRGGIGYRPAGGGKAA